MRLFNAPLRDGRCFLLAELLFDQFRKDEIYFAPFTFQFQDVVRSVNISRPGRNPNPLQPTKPNIEVRACKYDGSLHRTWRAELIHNDETLLILDGKFEVDIEHNLLGTIAAGTSSLEYYWLDRWYSVFRFGLPCGKLRSYYCNVNVPPTFDGQVLSYIDLDIDLLVQPDLTYQILDMDEFDKNSALYNYSTEVRRNSRDAVAELVRLIETQKFPFRS